MRLRGLGQMDQLKQTEAERVGTEGRRKQRQRGLGQMDRTKKLRLRGLEQMDQTKQTEAERVGTDRPDKAN